MKYHYETVLPAAGHSFATVDEIGSVVDCVFHVHPELELTYVESSFGVRFVGDNIGEFKPDDLVLIGSMLPHHYYNAPQDSEGETWSRLKVIKMREDFAGETLFELDEFREVRQLLSAASAGVVFSAATTDACRDQIYRIFDAEGASRVILLLDLLSRLAASDYTQLATQLPKPQISAPDERMARVLTFIHSRLDGNDTLNLSTTAEIACMTPQAFSHYFHKHTRKKFVDYVTELRIGRACGLLASSTRTVMDIALATGFRNLSNFNRHFSRLKQATPREYRKRTRNATQAASVNTPTRRATTIT